MEKENTVKKLSELFEYRQNYNESSGESTVKRSYKSKNTKKKNDEMSTPEIECQRSFLEVKNPQELSELKRNLTNMMNIQIAKMKEDSFINETEGVEIVDFDEDENIEDRQLQHSESSRKLLEKIPEKVEKTSHDYHEEKIEKDCIAKCIENSPIDILAYGTFKRKGKIRIISPIKLKSILLLFNNFLVFTIEDATSPDIFHYYMSIKTTNLKIIDVEDRIIKLTDLSKAMQAESPARHIFVLEAETTETCNIWKKAIQSTIENESSEIAEYDLVNPFSVPIKSIFLDPMDIKEEISSEGNRDKLSSLSSENEEDEKNGFQFDEIIKSNFEKANFGLLRIRGVFTLLVPVKGNAMVFLFENFIIIATENEADSENYKYYHSIQVKDLHIQALEDNKIIIEDLSAAQTFDDSKVPFVLKTNEKMWIKWKYTLENVVYDRLHTKNIQVTSNNTKELVKAVTDEPYEDSQPLSYTQSIQETALVTLPSYSLPPIPARTRTKSMNNFDINGKSEPFPTDKRKHENLPVLPPLPARNKQISIIQTKDAPPLPPRNKIQTNNTTSERLTENCLESSKLEDNSNVFKWIRNRPIDYDKYYGPFIMKEIFNVKRPISMKSTVFLFKNVVVLTRLNDNGVEPQTYDYFTSIKINDLSINSINDYTFTLTNFTKAKADNDPVKNTYHLKAETMEIATKWWESLESKLWNQLVQMKAEVKLPSLISKFKLTRCSDLESSQQSESKTKVENSGRTNKNDDDIAGLLLKSIKCSTISKKEYGAFKMKEIFQVIQPINFMSMVFLFENVVLITVFDKSDSGYFYFFGGIKIKELMLDSSKNCIIRLIESPNKSKKKHQKTTEKYILKAQTTEVWKLWIKTIKKMLPEKKL